jgi:hypothetical protein
MPGNRATPDARAARAVTVRTALFVDGFDELDGQDASPLDFLEAPASDQVAHALRR